MDQEDVRPTKKQRREDVSDNENGQNGHMTDGAVLAQNGVESAPNNSMSNLYLETINRSKVDFDFEKVCSVSLSKVNIYACLVCGKYYQGRGKNSHAYFHSVNDDHHPFINMTTKKVYILPENYEVQDPSLNDIKYVVNPTYTEAEVAMLDSKVFHGLTLEHKPYRQGFIGINNIKENDYANVILQTLTHVKPIRNFFLLNECSELQLSDNGNTELAQKFSLLTREIWNPKAFRSHISPHEFLHFVSSMSHKKFLITKQSDPFYIMTWLLNELHLSLGGSRTKMWSSLIQKTFQGRVQMDMIDIKSGNVTSKALPFLFLKLDLPPLPTFRSGRRTDAIQQVSLQTLLKKYNGVTESKDTVAKGYTRRFHILQPPQYLILHIDRFNNTLNKFTIMEDRNNTVVNFPLTMDICSLVKGGDEAEKRTGTSQYNYKLIANVVYQSTNQVSDLSTITPTKKVSDIAKNEQTIEKEHVKTEGATHSWKVQLLDEAAGEWYEIQDLEVKKIQQEMLILSETYIQVWERVHS